MVAAKRQGPPIQPLNVFLLKPGTTDFADGLVEEGIAALSRHRLMSSVPFEGELYLAPQRTAPPRWLAFLESGARGDLQRLYNASCSAVLFVRCSKRVLAFSFGYGRSLLHPERIVRGFGLRVVLNAVDEKKLRSVDTKTVRELSVYTRRQTSRTSRLAEFGVDKEEDLLGSVAGEPRDPAFARMLSGADALQLRAPVEFSRLGEKCREVLRAYRSDEYKQRGFEFVDHVQRVTDPCVIDGLDGELEDALLRRDLGGIHMSPPEIIDWQKIGGFSFTASASPVPDLNLDEFFAQIRKAEAITVERIKKRQRVFVHLTGAERARPEWSVYRTLVCEREHQGRRYVLSGGDWYGVDKQFARKILNRVSKIRSAGLDLPAAKRAEKEGSYNRRVARSGIYCIDAKCARVDGDPIELCDLYASGRRQFIHVKRWRASSTLSHLFAQGRVSTEAFLSDEKFRRDARKLLEGHASSLAAHVPSSQPDPSEYRVVFAIIKAGQGWKRSLPFFSQLGLVRAAESIRRLGFDVRMERIDVEP